MKMQREGRKTTLRRELMICQTFLILAAVGILTLVLAAVGMPLMAEQKIGQAMEARLAQTSDQLAGELEQKFLSAQAGTVQTVLIEKRTSPDYCNGFTEGYIPVRIYGEDIERHSLVKVKITEARGNFCVGVVIKEDKI